MEDTTLFRMASVTKVFTSLAVLQLRDEGKLDLDAPVERYLPEMARLRYPTADSPRITLRHLMTHTSGLPRLGRMNSFASYTHEMTEAELVGSLMACPEECPGDHRGVLQPRRGADGRGHRSRLGPDVPGLCEVAHLRPLEDGFEHLRVQQ